MGHESDPWDAHRGRREETPKSCPLISTRTITHAHAYGHTVGKQTNVVTIKKKHGGGEANTR